MPSRASVAAADKGGESVAKFLEIRAFFISRYCALICGKKTAGQFRTLWYTQRPGGREFALEARSVLERF
jgi:hypothetical protein